MVKLVLTQERFDRLVARGWTLDHGPGGTERGRTQAARRTGTTTALIDHLAVPV